MFGHIDSARCEMKNKLLITIFFILSAVMTVGCSESSDYEFVFTEYENGIELYRFVPHKDEFDTVIIPDEYEGKSVTKIEDNAFACSCSIKTIVLPSNLEIIGDNSFATKNRISLEKIPDTISYVGEIRFMDKDMNRFDILKNNSSYSVVDGAVLSEDGHCLLAYDSNLSNEEYVVPDGVTIISKNAFFGCKYLKKVVLPDTIEVLEENAFESCSNLEEINFPNSLKFMDTTSLYSTKWFDEQRGEVIINDKFYLKSELTDDTMTIPNGITHFLCDFGNFEQSPSIIKIPDSLEYISPNATIFATSFYVSVGNKNFVTDEDFLLSKDRTKLIRSTVRGDYSVTIPDTVSEICTNAFRYTMFNNIIIPNSVTTIDEGAFYDAEVVKIDIPDSVTKLNKNTFYGCYMLEELYIPNSVKNIHPLIKDDMIMFDDVDIKVEKGSFAQKYCELFDIEYDLV